MSVPNVIVIATNKGVVLKTTTTVNLAAVLCKEHKILICDLDNQGNVAVSFGLNPDSFENTLYDVLLNGLDPKEVIQNVYPNIDILISNDDLFFLEIDIWESKGKYENQYY